MAHPQMIRIVPTTCTSYTRFLYVDFEVSGKACVESESQSESEIPVTRYLDRSNLDLRW